MEGFTFDVNMLGAFLMFSLLIEGLVENLKWTIEDIVALIKKRPADATNSWNGAKLIAFVVAIGFAVVYGIDIFAKLGYATQIPYVGSVATGILFARGANWVYDFFSGAKARLVVNKAEELPRG